LNSVLLFYLIINWLFYLGSYHTSRRQIESELLRIIMQDWQLDDLLSNQMNTDIFINAFKLVQHRSTTGSLSVYDDFEITELQQFRLIYNLLVEETITGMEHFPGKMLTPQKMYVQLPDNMYSLLVKFYKNAYELDFVTLTESIRRNANEDFTIVRPIINQFGRIQIGTEVFGSTLATRYKRNSYILAKFLMEDDSIEIFPGQVQFYFEHEIKKKIHRLAFVKWFSRTQRRIRFNCQINSDDIESCNIELWQSTFSKTERDSIIPVHHIYSRFIPTEFSVGKKRNNVIQYMAVIPINRHFHL
jgi:hypothetical protein